MKYLYLLRRLWPFLRLIHEITHIEQRTVHCSGATWEEIRIVCNPRDYGDQYP